MYGNKEEMERGGQRIDNHLWTKVLSVEALSREEDLDIIDCQIDATNSTKQRRNWSLAQCGKATEISGKETGVVFVESICDDLELLNENFHVKISTCPDFSIMSQEDALQDLRELVQK